MDPISSSGALTASPSTQGSASFAALGSDDFLRLLITQLTHQDPLAPTGNEELLRQISSIRDIELSTTLTRSLQNLTGQQNFASASALIGRFVTGQGGPDGEAISGVVAGVRFDGAGRAVLQLANGAELGLDQVTAIEPPERIAETLVGQTIIGVDRRKPAEPQSLEGVVTGVRTDGAGGEVLLELDTGKDLRLRDVLGVRAAAA